MTDIANNIKKAEIGLGILALSFASLEGQKIDSYTRNKYKGDNYNIDHCTFKPFERYDRNFPTVKVGPTFNRVQRNGFSDKGPGVEVLVEDELSRKLFVEWELGMCALYDYKARNGAIHYSAWQSNLGVGYKALMMNSWTVGGKLAFGASDEFYKERTGARTEKWYLNKIVELEIEKIFANNLGLGVGVSREIDRDMWRIGARLIVKPDTFKNRSQKHHGYYNRKSSR